MRKVFNRFRKSTVELLMQRAAEASGEAARSAVMAQFYEEQLKHVDPHTDWWRFAELKQKLHDSQADQTHFSQLADEAMAKVAAQQASEKVADPGMASPPASSHPDSQDASRPSNWPIRSSTGE